MTCKSASKELNEQAEKESEACCKATFRINTMENRTITLHATRNQTNASRLSEPSIASKSIPRGGGYVFPSVVKFLVAFLLVATATMNLNAVVISHTATMLAVSPSEPVALGAMVTL